MGRDVVKVEVGGGEWKVGSRIKFDLCSFQCSLHMLLHIKPRPSLSKGTDLRVVSRN